jgi:cellulose synthase/poly-beta-1,6-N-acetylglucosamine synthase-like glycosyltransferase
MLYKRPRFFLVFPGRSIPSGGGRRLRGADLLNFCIIIIHLYLLPYVVFIFLTSLAAIVSRKPTGRTPALASPEQSWRRRFLIVIPAHDEAANIEKTVLSCRAMHYPAALFEVLVLADNCTDDTASRAQAAQARVLERFDLARKSKGHAIDFLITRLVRSGEFDSLDALVIIDADSTVQPELLERFAEALDRGCDWMQCYGGVANATQSWRTRLMAYGFSLINGVTLAGQNALGLSAGLRGNGMCISTSGLRRVPWKAHGLAEDLEYSWIVRIAGGRIAFVEDAAVFATMLTEGGRPLANQRRRWEFGRGALRFAMFGPLLRSPHLGWLEKTAALVELIAQPTINIVCLYVLVSVLSLFAIPGMVRDHEYTILLFIAVSHALATVALLVHALSPFLLHLIPWRFALSLGYLPYYAIWKLIVMAQGRPQTWVRTPRDTYRAPNAHFDVLPAPALSTEKGEPRE